MNLPPDAAGRLPLNGGALTPRDVELVRHLAAGRSTSEIAAAMSITTNTVRTHIRRLEAKLAAPDRGAVVQAARSRGIL